MSNNITVIIPIHKLEEKYINGCVESIKNQKTIPDQVLIVRSDDTNLTKFLETYDFGDLKEITKVIHNETGNYDFQSQINYGVEQCESEGRVFDGRQSDRRKGERCRFPGSSRAGGDAGQC